MHTQEDHLKQREWAIQMTCVIHMSLCLRSRTETMPRDRLRESLRRDWVGSRVSMLLFKMATGKCGHSVFCVLFISIRAMQISSESVGKANGERLVTGRKRIPPGALSQHPVVAKSGYHTAMTTL